MDLSFLVLLSKIFTRRDKIIIFWLLLLSVIVSIVETISISALMFFISLATNFELIFKYTYLAKLYRFLGYTKPADLIIFLGFGLIVFYFFRALLNAIHIYCLNNFAYLRQYVFATKVFARYMQLSYQDFATQSSATLHHLLFPYMGNVTHVNNALLVLFSEFFTVACIYGMLFYVNWKMTLALTILLVCKLVVIVKVFSARITAAGKKCQRFSLAGGKIFTESFGNFKFLKLVGSQDAMRSRFAQTSLGFAQANAVNGVWQGLPRFVLETLGFMVLIGILIYVVFRYNNAQSVIPMVSMYALAFYRFLPSLNKMMTSYNQIIFNKHAIRPVYDFLHAPHEQLGALPLTFKKTITWQNVSFVYRQGSVVLDEVNLTINKGERIGLMGPSGAGKSTASDLLMGLLQPTRGSIVIDDLPLTSNNCRSWRHAIGYVPQSIYLFDGTVADNVVCGRKYDEAKVKAALKQAHIYDFLLSQEDIFTIVGEGGINLSGGQKQRIALARALYGDPEILVLDEATSALDHATEEKIMDEIYLLDRQMTLIIIAHRLTTIQRCDRVFLVEARQVKEVAKSPNQQPVQKAFSA